ncbi:MAG: NAD(P)H-binding protein [Opitutaceae bacterium]|nr:NAD(P)H-binding protein [Opitutaceae bacterium]
MLESQNAAEPGLILLTGATGYVGGRLLRALAQRGCRVRCLARRPESLTSRVPAGTEVVAGDCLRRETLDPALAGVHTQRQRRCQRAVAALAEQRAQPLHDVHVAVTHGAVDDQHDAIGQRAPLGQVQRCDQPARIVRDRHRARRHLRRRTQGLPQQQQRQDQDRQAHASTG